MNIIEFLLEQNLLKQKFFTLFIVSVYIIIIPIALSAIENEKFKDMWWSSNFFGKIFTCICIVISFPAFIIHVFINLFCWLHDFMFPRNAGYTLKVSYDKDIYTALKENKIYCEHWGQACLETSVIVFLWEKDFKKALKILPELQDRIVT